MKRLYFVGAPECASRLRLIQGLNPANGSVHKLEMAHHQRCLVEVVLGPEFASLGKTIRDSRFRTGFNAVILSVSREGRRVPGKLGDITFRKGGTLLLEASHQFLEQYRFRRDFLLVSALNDSTPPDFHKAPRALGILAVMVLLSATGLLTILEAALLAAGAMIVTGCLTASRARRSVDLPVLVVIASSFALGTAMTETGAAVWVASGLLGFGPLTPWLALVIVYVLTAIFTEMITNNAAAVLMFPHRSGGFRAIGCGFPTFFRCRYVRRLGFVYYPIGLPDEPYGLRAGAVSVYRLFALGRAPFDVDWVCGDWIDSVGVGVLKGCPCSVVSENTTG